MIAIFILCFGAFLAKGMSLLSFESDVASIKLNVLDNSMFVVVLETDMGHRIEDYDNPEGEGFIIVDNGNLNNGNTRQDSAETRSDIEVSDLKQEALPVSTYLAPSSSSVEDNYSEENSFVSSNDTNVFFQNTSARNEGLKVTPPSDFRKMDDVDFEDNWFDYRATGNSEPRFNFIQVSNVK